jgi:hypothetical protein
MILKMHFLKKKIAGMLAIATYLCKDLKIIGIKKNSTGKENVWSDTESDPVPKKIFSYSHPDSTVIITFFSLETRGKAKIESGITELLSEAASSSSRRSHDIHYVNLYCHLF